MVKHKGEWREIDWQSALQTVLDGTNKVKDEFGPDQIAGFISPHSTLEEAYLFRVLLCGMGINNVDHRLREQSFDDEGYNYNPDNWCLSDIKLSDEVVLVGCNIRAEQPIIANRVRQATLQGTRVIDINFFAANLLIPVDTQVTVNAKAMINTLAGIAKELLIRTKGSCPAVVWRLMVLRVLV